MLNGGFLALLMGVLIVVLPVAGCGGDAGNDTTTSSTSKAEFVKDANAICARGEKQMNADYLAFSHEKNDNPNPSPVEYEEFVTRVIAPNVTRQVTELRALGTPVGDEGRAGAFLAAIEEGLRKAEEKPELVVTATNLIFGKAIKLATKYGLPACAELY